MEDGRAFGEFPGLGQVVRAEDERVVAAKCPLRAQCTKSRAAPRSLQITSKTEALWRLRKKQKTKRFRRRYRKRVVVEHRIGRMVQLGTRQARNFGKAKVGFQVALAATVANLMLVVAVSEPAPSVALPLVVLAAIASPAVRWLTARVKTLEMAPSRPGF